MTDPANGHPRSELSAYLDDRLGVDERAATDRHLASCEDCRAELAAMRRLAQAVGREEVPLVPSDLAARIGRRVDAATVGRFPKRRFFVPATIAATLGAIGLLVALQWREGHLGAPAMRTSESVEERDRSTDALKPGSAPASRVTKGDTSASRQARPEKEREQSDKDVKRTDRPADGERFKQKKDETVKSGVDEGVAGEGPSGSLEGMATGGVAQPTVDDRSDRGLAKVMNEQAAAPLPRAPAAKSVAVSSCAERWSDSGLRASWAVTDLEASERQLGRIAHAVGGIGLWRGVTDGRPYVVVVPRERFEEVFYALHARGVTGLVEPPTLPEGTDCIAISVALTGAASPKPRRPRRSRTVRRDRRRRAAPTPAPSL